MFNTGYRKVAIVKIKRGSRGNKTNNKLSPLGMVQTETFSLCVNATYTINESNVVQLEEPQGSRLRRWPLGQNGGCYIIWLVPSRLHRAHGTAGGKVRSHHPLLPHLAPCRCTKTTGDGSKLENFNRQPSPKCQSFLALSLIFGG